MLSAFLAFTMSKLATGFGDSMLQKGFMLQMMDEDIRRELQTQPKPLATGHSNDSNGSCYNKSPAGYGPVNVGACRTADGDEGSGMYTRVDHVENVAQCARECDADPTCFAFEFTGTTHDLTGCELHHQPMPAATGHSNSLCYNKIPVGPVVAGYGPAIVGACRTADGDGSGTYTRADHVGNVEQCASECDASPTCVAFEFVVETHGHILIACELHTQPMPLATGHPKGLCYNAVRANNSRTMSI